MIINVRLACLLGSNCTSQNQCEGLGVMIQYNVLCDKHCNSLWVHVLGCRKQEDRVKLKGGKVVKRRHTQCLSNVYHSITGQTFWLHGLLVGHLNIAGPKGWHSHELEFWLSPSQWKRIPIAQGYLFGLYFFRAWKQTTKNEINDSEEKGHSTVQNMLWHWWWNHKQ